MVSNQLANVAFTVLPLLAIQLVLRTHSTHVIRVPPSGLICLQPGYRRPKHFDLALLAGDQSVVLEHLGDQSGGKMEEPVRSATIAAARQWKALRDGAFSMVMVGGEYASGRRVGRTEGSTSGRGKTNPMIARPPSIC